MNKMIYFQLKDEQQAELAKSFASADEVIWYIKPSQPIIEKSFVLLKTFSNLLIDHFPKRETKVQMTLIFEKDGDGILTAEEYKTAFHKHGVFVGEEPLIIFIRCELHFCLL